MFTFLLFLARDNELSFEHWEAEVKIEESHSLFLVLPSFRLSLVLNKSVMIILTHTSFILKVYCIMYAKYKIPNHISIENESHKIEVEFIEHFVCTEGFQAWHT